MPTFYEFFAGGGMARAGLGENWNCIFANDFDQKKAASYIANWGRNDLVVADVAQLSAKELPGAVDLAWASFPCQDLSLAGGGAGLKGNRSGTFWPFWKLVQSLDAENRAPKLIVLENVCGVLHSNCGKDFVSISNALARAGYSFGALIIDAVAFVPQSRPRLFFVAARLKEADRRLFADNPGHFHPSSLVSAYGTLTLPTRQNWRWWKLPPPPARNDVFADIIEDEPRTVSWHSSAQTAGILSMMSEVNREKVRKAQQVGKRMIGGVYRRTRLDELGRKVQRAEVRFDDIAGCLRTPAGGSSRQTILVVENDCIRSRLLSPREAARLMGLPDDYRLPDNYNEAYHLAGDGVVVPVVRYLARNLLEPLLASTKRKRQRTAA